MSKRKCANKRPIRKSPQVIVPPRLLRSNKFLILVHAFLLVEDDDAIS